MGEGRYRPLLCLVQVAVEDGGRRDPRRGPRPARGRLRPGPARGASSPTPMSRSCSTPDARTSRSCAASGRPTSRTSSTRRSPPGSPAGGRSSATRRCCRELTGVRLRKSASFTRWDARPLSEEQVRYAREDVLHLLQLADALQEELDARGRLGWAREECRALEDVSDERDADAIFARLPRVNSLDPAQRAVARELVEWREGSPATATGRCRASWPTRRSSRSPSAGRRASSAWRRSAGSTRARCAAVGTRSSPPSSAAAGATRSRRTACAARRPIAGDAPLIALAEALVRARAAEAGARVRAARGARGPPADRHRAARGQPASREVRTLQGWRRELVGDELLELLAGRRSLRVGEALQIAVDER